MRISDWSSDVCSSDLVAPRQVGQGHRDHQRQFAPDLPLGLQRRGDAGLGVQRVENRLDQDEVGAPFGQRDHLVAIDVLQFVEVDLRSEEHTSELQSLMRISYAVFCLKKKI